ncbi:carbon-nitrogen hydrolase family protein [Leucobacter sp. USHLN153]|uniref:carbon-nitrogen hydrolase family protein n=1 Tax=Leucobacter sp. USHLN153 TaxID=3081268 RepID=UPI00301B3691
MSKVAVVQAGSVIFDTEASTEKALKYIAEVAANGAQHVVFPEAFLGGYPKGSAYGAAIGVRTEVGREEYLRYVNSAVSIDGPEVRRLIEASAEHGISMVMGVIEKLGNTLYCTALLIHPQDGLVGFHRKLMPTGTERLIWGFGDGSTLDVMDTEVGRVGSVICWENYMPLMRQAMYAKGTEIYCVPTADDRDTWQSTMQHIALEGRVFVLSACQYIHRDSFPPEHQVDFEPAFGDDFMRGGSVIIDPTGKVLAGPVFGEETVLYADIDLDVKSKSHLDFDSVGHYARPDVFTLTVNTQAANSVSFTA